MIFQVENNPEGFVVSVYHDLYWHPLRNFGVRQGDAIAFKEWDCPNLNEAHLRLLEKNYSPDRKYIRISASRFITER